MEIEPKGQEKGQGYLVAHLEEMLSEEVSIRQRILSYLKQEECALSVADWVFKKELLEVSLSLSKGLQLLFKERQRLIKRLIGSCKGGQERLEALSEVLGEHGELIVVLYEKQQQLAMESYMQHIRNKNLAAILKRKVLPFPFQKEKKVGKRLGKILMVKESDDLSNI